MYSKKLTNTLLDIIENNMPQYVNLSFIDDLPYLYETEMNDDEIYELLKDDYSEIDEYFRWYADSDGGSIRAYLQIALVNVFDEVVPEDYMQELFTPRMHREVRKNILKYRM